MEIARILEKLKESPCTWNYFGPPSEEVFAVSLTGSGAHFHSGVLYSTPRIVTSMPICMKTCASWSRSPIMLPAFLRSSSSGFSSGDTTLITACRPNAFLMRLQNSPFMLLEPGDGLDPLPRRMLYMRICQEQADILLFTAEQENSFADTDAASRLAALREAFASIPLKQEHLCPQLQLQNLLFRLLQNKPSNEEDIKKQLTALGWTFYEKYYVLAIYRKLQNCPGSLAEEISHILGEKVYEFGDYYISILHSDWKRELYALFGRNFPELKALIQRTDMYASLSYGFFDIINAATAMKQATRCIEIIRKFSWSQRINGYGDMVISHLIDTALACGEITLDSVCHPIALKIREYDDKNGTDLLDVLATYIYSGLSVKISSEYLHMHINTVYQRIHKLEEDFDIDFSDRRIVTMLHISIIAMAYRGDYPADRYL